MAVIVNINFNAGNLSEFTSTTDPDGDLSASVAAAMAGSAYGMAIIIDDLTATYGTKTITENTTGLARFRIYIDPNSMTMGSGEAFDCLHLRRTGGNFCVLKLKYLSGSYQLAIRLEAASGGGTSSYVNITDAPHYVEAYATRASGDGITDGTMSWWIDGIAQTGFTAADNYTEFPQCTGAFVGAVIDVDAGTSGTFYLDELVVNDDGGLIGAITYSSSSGAITPTGGIVNSARKILAGMLTPAGALQTEFQGGEGEEYEQAVGGSITPAGAITNSARKILAGALTPAGPIVFIRDAFISVGGSVVSVGDVVKRTNKPLTGGITPSGVVTGIKTALVSLAGTLAPVGDLIRQTSKAVSGSLSPAGSVIKQAGKLLAGSITPNGALTRMAGKLLSGALAAAGNLAAQYLPGGGGVLYFQSVSGALAAIGTLFAGIVSSPGRVINSDERGFVLTGAERSFIFTGDLRLWVIQSG